MNDKPASTWSQLYLSCFSDNSVWKKNQQKKTKAEHNNNGGRMDVELYQNQTRINRDDTHVGHTHTHITIQLTICSNISTYSADKNY